MTIDPAIREAAAACVAKAIASGALPRLRAYQAERLASGSRFNLDCWSRQTGKSMTNAMDAVHLATATDEDVMYLSASRDLTVEAMGKVASYVEALTGAAGEVRAALAAGELDETLYHDDGVAITQTIITMPNGKRVVGRPANPRTARGFSAHLKLDEFAMHRDQDEIWRAAYPNITSRRHLRCDVLSTPGLSMGDKFEELARAAERGEGNFAFRRVTIHDAVRDGLDVDPEELRRNLRDETAWRREYLCEFVDEAGSFLPLTLIRGCEHEGIRAALPIDPARWNPAELGWDPHAGELFLGADIGRRHDLTVLWLLQMLGDVAWTRAVVEMRNTPFSEQRAVGELLIEHLGVRRCCVDATGLGMQLAEEWATRFGAVVEPVTFTSKTKPALAEGLRARFEDKLLRIPVSPEIRDDLHSIRRTVTAAQNVRYLAERSADGHADRFWALALAHHALESPCPAGAVLL